MGGKIYWMAEKHVAEKLKKCSPRLLWKPISDKYGVGTPDRAILVRGVGISSFGELKHLKQAPITKCKCGLKSHQARWLQEWKDNGGSCFLIIGVGKDKVAIFANGFIDIFKNGLCREQFDLINYEEVESKLLGMMRDGKESRR